MRHLPAAIAVVFLVGCADQALVSTTAPTVVASQTTEITTKTTLVCHKESAIGSQMIHTVCEAPQTEADRQATQRMLKNNIPQGGIAPQ